MKNVNIKTNRITSSELAILSLVAEKPLHGYQIEQLIQERGMREWTEIGFSSIYYLLNKLEKKGFVISKIQAPQGQGPARRVYTPTESGMKKLTQEIHFALSYPQRGESNFLLGLANCSLLNDEEIIKALKEYETLLENKQHQLLTKKKNQDTETPYYVLAMFDYSIVLLDCERNWVKKFSSLIKKKSGQ